MKCFFRKKDSIETCMRVSFRQAKAVLFFTHNAAKSMAYPKGNTLEEEEAWEKEHGFRANRYGAVKYVDTYIDLGYNCIIYDMRGHGENEIPICFIHGVSDQFILPINSEINKENDQGDSELYLVPGAGHAESREVLGSVKVNHRRV